MYNEYVKQILQMGLEYQKIELQNLSNHLIDLKKLFQEIENSLELLKKLNTTNFQNQIDKIFKFYGLKTKYSEFIRDPSNSRYTDYYVKINKEFESNLKLLETLLEKTLNDITTNSFDDLNNQINQGENLIAHLDSELANFLAQPFAPVNMPEFVLKAHRLELPKP